MKREPIIFIICLAVITAMIYFTFVNVANADVDLSQCTINNNIDACNQSVEKSLEVVEVKQVTETKDKMTLEEFIITLVGMVEERNSKEAITVTTSFESDTYDSVLIENKNEMKCVNNICAKEKEWK